MTVFTAAQGNHTGRNKFRTSCLHCLCQLPRLAALNFQVHIKAQGLGPHLILKHLKDRSISGFGLSQKRDGLEKPHATLANLTWNKYNLLLYYSATDGQRSGVWGMKVISMFSLLPRNVGK